MTVFDNLRSTTDSHRVIHGRRWRRTDPGIEEATRQALVDELMAARRAVKTALGSGDADAERVARSRVHDAKVALGERGPAWWRPVTADEVGGRRESARRALADRPDVDDLLDGLHLDAVSRSGSADARG